MISYITDMKKWKILFCIHLVLSQLILKAQSEQSALKVSYANDFFTGTDQYFTQGVRIEYINPRLKKTPVSFLNFLPKKEKTTYYSLAIQQDGFTPASIRHDSILQDDRPFCGSLFFTNSVYSYSEGRKSIFHTQLNVGVIGPLALGFEEQTAIHRAIKDELPHGWKNQVQNDLVLNYTIAVRKSLFEKKLFDISGLTSIRAGTIYTDAALGISTRLGLKEKWYRNMGVHKENKLQIYGKAGATLKAVAYNATMQGGLINKTSVQTIGRNEISRVVGSAEISLVTSYKRVQIEYSHSYITREFKKGSSHAWGSLSLMFGF